MKYDIIIWDFNGTIADDVTAGIEGTNILLRRRGMKPIDSVEFYHSLLIFPIRGYYKKLGFDFEREPYEELSREWMLEYNRMEPDIKMNDRVPEMLEKIRCAGIKQAVISASEKEILLRQLDKFGITEYFCDILALDNIYADSKLKIAENYFSGRNEKALFIGDTVHDFECATTVGADCILFSGGHSSVSTLSSCSAPVIGKICELCKYIF